MPIKLLIPNLRVSKKNFFKTRKNGAMNKEGTTYSVCLAVRSEIT